MKCNKIGENLVAQRFSTLCVKKVVPKPNYYTLTNNTVLKKFQSEKMSVNESCISISVQLDKIQNIYMLHAMYKTNKIIYTSLKLYTKHVT